MNAWYVAMFVVSVSILVAVAIPTVHGALQDSDTVVLESRVERHAAILASGLPAYQTAVESSAALNESVSPVRVRDASGATVYAYGDLEASRRTSERSTGALRLDVGAATSPWRDAFERLRPGAIALALGAMLLAIVGGFALARRGLRPVRELASTAREVIRSGDLSRRVPERGSADELDELSTLFNRMLARNAALVGGMRDALDNAAHDLRTPLTRLRGTAEVALGSDDAAAAREALAVCIEESDHVLAMLRTLLDISEAETGILRLELAPVALGRLAADVADLYEQVAEDAAIALAVAPAPPEPVTVTADGARLRQAIANLVDNAIKYTPRGGQVTLEVAREGGDAVIRVRDTGEGIPTAALPRIWDRLYRAEPSRSKPGLGLGLSLVKAIVVAHGGRVAVDSSSAGSTFTIALPAAAA